MMLVNWAAFSSKDVVFHLLRKQNMLQMFHPASYSIMCKKIEADDLQNTYYRRQLLKSIHVTKVNQDVEAGMRAIGSGLAAVGVLGSGIGLGLIFGNYVAAVGRNPSAAGILMTPAILGMSFCEAIALFALVVSFMIMP